MSQSYTQFKISALRAHNVQKVNEAVMVNVAALFSLMVLPQLLITLVLGETAYLQPPAYLSQIPFFAYGFAMVYTAYVVIGNLRRATQIKTLMQELEVQQAFSDDATPAVAAAELEQLERMVDEALAESAPADKPKAARKTKSASAKKSTKKSTRKSKK